MTLGFSSYINLRLLTELALDHLAADAQLIKIIRLPLRHAHSLSPVSAAVVGRPHLVAVAVSQGPFDCVGMSKARFIEQRAGHRAKAMARHFVAFVAKAPKSDIERVLAHRPLGGVEGGEHELARSGERTQLL